MALNIQDSIAYNFGLLIRWLRLLFFQILTALIGELLLAPT